jgi:predicted transcriptional regulator
MFKRGGWKAAASILKRHLMPDRKLTVDQHRQKWGLRFGYPVVSPDDAKTRFALAMKIGAMKIGAMKIGTMKIGLGRKGPAAQKKAARRR